MILPTDLTRTLVATLTPLHVTVADRRRHMDAAFSDDAALRDCLTPDGEPRDYSARLVSRLAERRTRTTWALLRYVQAVHDDTTQWRLGDLSRTLSGLLRQLESLERLRVTLLAAGRDPTTATVEDAIELYLQNDLVAGIVPIVAQYVALDFSQQQLRAPEPTLRGEWADIFGGPSAYRRPAPLDAEYHPARTEQPGQRVPDAADRLLTVQRAVLLGDPGSGKTWTLGYVAWRMARHWLAARHAGHDTAALPVPLFLPLRSFTGSRGEPPEPHAFHDFVAERLGMLAPYAATLGGQIVYLCDALNEMRRTSADGRTLLDEVIGLLKPKARYVVSCRVRDYREELTPLYPLERLRLRELEPPQILAVATRRLGEADGQRLWQALGGSQGLLRFWTAVQGKSEEAAFWQAGARVPGYTKVEDDADWRTMHRRLMPLCRTPFVLAVAADVLAADGALPDSRVALFQTFVETLLRREQAQAALRGEPWPGDGPLLAAMTRVAAAMQALGGTVLPRSAAEQAAADRALLEAAISASLLLDEGGELRFSHQLVQDYFAARELLETLERGNVGTLERESGKTAERGSGAAALFGKAWWEAGIWRESLLILGEVVGEGRVGANRVARWLADASPEVALSVILRHGAGLSLADVEDTTRQALVASATAKSDDADPRGRAAAYRVLALLGADPRDGVGLDADGLPDIEWVYLEGGAFPMGGDKEAFNSLDYREAEPVGAFAMARYPVTNAQWQAFVDDEEGYGNERWWREAGCRSRRWRSQAGATPTTRARQ